MQTNALMIAILRLEGLAFGIVCTWLYHAFGESWWWFAGLFLFPDLSMLGYLKGPRIGAIAYNAVHCWATPIALFFFFVYVTGGGPLLLSLPLILGAHIGFDRALGYGLKLPTGFQDTHLGRIGGLASVLPRVGG